jgi:hypothetical protein
MAGAKLALREPDPSADVKEWHARDQSLDPLFLEAILDEMDLDGAPLIAAACLNSLTLQPVRIATRFEEGMLIFNDEQRLVAMLTHVSEQTGFHPGSGFWRHALGGSAGSILPPLPIWMSHKIGSAGISPTGQELAVPHKAFPAVWTHEPWRSAHGTFSK